MNGYFKDLFSGAKSLLVGLGCTWKTFREPMVTVHYPREKIDITPNFRGHTELIVDPEKPLGHRCIVCGRCSRECPSGCIVLRGEKREGVKGKALAQYDLDFTKCSLCGTCVEICPTSALDYSQEYELAGFTREEFHYDLLKRLEENR